MRVLPAANRVTCCSFSSGWWCGGWKVHRLVERHIQTHSYPNNSGVNNCGRRVRSLSNSPKPKSMHAILFAMLGWSYEMLLEKHPTAGWFIRCNTGTRSFWCFRFRCCGVESPLAGEMFCHENLRFFAIIEVFRTIGKFTGFRWIHIFGDHVL